MRRSSTSAIALLAVSALPLLTVAPAFATQDRTAISIDCVEGGPGNRGHVLAPNETVTITLTNCDDGVREIRDDNSSGNVTLDGTVLTSSYVVITSDPATIVVDGFASLDISDFGPIHVSGAVLADDPSGALLASEGLTMNAEPNFLTTPADAEEDEWGGILLGGSEQCWLEVGDHPYSGLNITVAESGLYTFRVAQVAPAPDEFHFNNEIEGNLADSFLALYNNFDPENIDDNVIGCNDDLSDEGAASAESWTEAETISETRPQDDTFLYTSGNDILSNNFSWITVPLEPGVYTLVGTTNNSVDQERWSDDLVELGVVEENLLIEMWGPDGGITAIDTYIPTLATTGVEPALALWSGLALAGTGVAITVARRRANRA